jgi:hypothetical protein
MSSVQVYRSESGELRIRTDAPGERAVSAAVTDPAGLIQQIADEAGLLVEIVDTTGTSGSGSGSGS